MRNPLSRLILICGLGFLISPLNGRCSVISEGIPPLRTVSDLAVYTNSDGVSTLYVADKDAGVIYSAEYATKSNVSFSDFQPIFASPKYAHPVSIAYDDGQLYICDAVAGVFSLDLTSRAIQPILGGFEVKDPISVAALNGKIAIADRGKNGIFLARLDGGTASFTGFTSATSLGRIAFYGEKIVVLDERTSALLWLDQSAKESVLRHDPGLRDFRIYDGVFYLSYENHLAGLGKGSMDATPLPLFTDTMASGAPGAFAIDLGGLFIVDSKTSYIRRMPLQVPAKLSLSSEAAASNAALIEVYRYLFSKNILPVRQIEVQPSEKSLSSILLDQKVIVPPFSSIPEQSLGRLKELLCAISRIGCGTTKLRWENPLRHGSSVKVPFIGLTSFLSSDVRTFRGESFEHYVTENISRDLVADAMKRFSFLEKVADLPQASLEEYLRSKGFTPLSIPNVSMQPGRLLVTRTESGHDPFAIAGSFECTRGKTLDVSSEPINLPSSSVLRDVHPNNGILTGLGTVATVEVRADQAELETATTEHLTHYVSGGECGILAGYGHAQIIVQAIKVLGLRYRFADDKGNTIVPSPDKLMEMGFPARIDPEGAWSLIIDFPVYIAYRAVEPERWNSLQSVGLKTVESSNLYGKYVVPSQVSEARVMVFKQDLTDPKSPLMKIHSPSQGIYILQAEAPKAMASSAPPSEPPTVDSASFEAASRERANLLASIHYDPTLIPGDMSTTYIAVGENKQSIDFQHIAFWDANNNSCWWTLGAGQAGLTSVTRAASPPATSEAISPFSEAQDHGSHVGGLLCARVGKLGPGLIPKASLVMLDTSDISDLTSLIDRAVGTDVRLFNFSFEQVLPPGNESIYDSLKQKITSSSFALFIVAAGNEGRQVNGALIPIGFCEDQPNNVIGVAAADGLHKLDEWLDDSDRIKIGTNYGGKYVQLLAPGKSIYSVGHDNGYTKATGSSQAVPQVTAAAAVLFAQGHRDPWRIKQRLMYTADWLENFRPFAWGGGLLNFRRAVWHPELNLWIGQSSPGQIFSFTISASAPVTISGSPRFDQPDGLSDGSVPSQLFLTSILRISTQANKKLRVIYRDSTDRLKILKDATISGSITCHDLRVWDNSSQQFKPAVSDLCTTGGIRADQVFDYVAAMP